MKRKLNDTECENFRFRSKKSVVTNPQLDDKFLARCETEFLNKPVNIIARNAINSVGSMLGTINSTRINEISYIFLNSVKKPNLRATNQGASGRCWMFAALNTFRHILINAMDLDNFEFSEVYLFFWDKLERSNSYLQWFIDHPEYKPGDLAYDYMITDYMTDGGWWNTFANLVDKYGVIPYSAMQETYQSDDSDDMNKIIKEQLDSCVNHIRKNLNLSKGELEKIKQNTVQQVYDTLVKFLGHPPKKFDWSFMTNDEVPGQVVRVTPQDFLSMVAPDINMNRDFVTLTHLPLPNLKYYQSYKIRYTNNVVEGENCTVFNVPVDELARYAMKSISNGLAVWFVGDVHQSFNWYHSALDDKLDDHKTVFGETYKFDKGDRILLKNVQGCHAMALTGFNTNDKGQPISWQVENSWGYWDNETPGKDGFLFMSHSWFEKYVTEIVVMKRFLSRTMLQKVESSVPIEINPWESMAPAIKAGINNPPKSYLEMFKKK